MPSGIDAEPELGGDDHLVAKGRDRFADEFFVREGAVRFRGVEERHAVIERRADDPNCLLVVGGGAVDCREAHAPVAESRDRELAVAERAGLHS